MNITLCPTQAVDQAWPKIAAGFGRALARGGGDLTIPDLWVTARSGQGFLFLAHDETGIHAASLYRFDTWSTGVRFRCLAIYGDKPAEEWFDAMLSEAERIGRMGQAVEIITEGRDGWGRRVKRLRRLRNTYAMPIEGEP